MCKVHAFIKSAQFGHFLGYAVLLNASLFTMYTQKTIFLCDQDCNSTSVHVAIHVKCFNHKIITLHLLNY